MKNEAALKEEIADKKQKIEEQEKEIIKRVRDNTYKAEEYTR